MLIAVTTNAFSSDVSLRGALRSVFFFFQVSIHICRIVIGDNIDLHSHDYFDQAQDQRCDKHRSLHAKFSQDRTVRYNRVHNGFLLALISDRLS